MTVARYTHTLCALARHPSDHPTPYSYTATTPS